MKVPLCGATWLIEEMPCNDVAGVCLAAPWMSYVLAAFWSASLRNWALAGVAPLDFGLICDEKGRYVLVVMHMIFH
jgi:hypothetical protein